MNIDLRIKQRIAVARAETMAKLAKAESYSYDLQKPVQIDFYREHIKFLDLLAAGGDPTAAKANLTNWDVTRAVLNARKELA